MTTPLTCEGFNKRGYRCKALPLEGSRRCAYHPLTDEQTEQRKEATEQARGKRRAVRERLREVAETEANSIAQAYLDARQAVNTDGDPDHRTRLIAVEGLLAQVYGKPVQPTEEKGAVSFVLVRHPKLSVDEMALEDSPDLLPLQ